MALTFLGLVFCVVVFFANLGSIADGLHTCHQSFKNANSRRRRGCFSSQRRRASYHTPYLILYPPLPYEIAIHSVTMRKTTRRSGARTLTLATGALLACSACLVTPVVAAPPASLVLGKCKGNDNPSSQGRSCETMTPPGLLKKSEIEIELEDGTKAVFKKKQLPANLDNNGNAWFGEDESGSLQTMNLVTRNGLTVGSFITGDIIHQISTASDGSLRVLSTPENEFPETHFRNVAEPETHEGIIEGDGHENIFKNVDFFAGDRKLTATTSSSKLIVPATVSNGLLRGTPIDQRKLNTGSSIDVMILWTKEAECRNAGGSSGCNTVDENSRASMEALAELAILETNTAYLNSGIDIVLRLVHMYRDENYVEASSNAYNVALDDLTTKGDGVLDDAHDKRDYYGADIVAMLIDDGQYCGLGWVRMFVLVISIIFSY